MLQRLYIKKQQFVLCPFVSAVDSSSPLHQLMGKASMTTELWDYQNRQSPRSMFSLLFPSEVLKALASP